MFLRRVLFLSIIFALLLPLQTFAQTASEPASRIKSKNISIRQSQNSSTEAKLTSNTVTGEMIKKILDEKRIFIDQQHELLKTKLASITAEKKQDLILNLNTKIASINSRRTIDMSNAITKLQTILDKFGTNEAMIIGNCNTLELDNAIANAQTVLASASATVSTQAGKTYSLDITDQTTIRQSLDQMVKQLKQDLRNTHKTVIDAKIAVMKVALELKKVRICTNINSFPSKKPNMTPIIPSAIPSLYLSPTVTIH
jgi:hypothetical protein